MVDLVATKGERAFLISMKWQQTSGTAEQKVPFEVICLIKALDEYAERYQSAYLVLGGDGWSMRDFYVRDGLARYIPAHRKVTIVTLEGFLGIANLGKL